MYSSCVTTRSRALIAASSLSWTTLTQAHPSTDGSRSSRGRRPLQLATRDSERAAGALGRALVHNEDSMAPGYARLPQSRPRHASLRSSGHLAQLSSVLEAMPIARRRWNDAALLRRCRSAAVMPSSLTIPVGAPHLHHLASLILAPTGAPPIYADGSVPLCGNQHSGGPVDVGRDEFVMQEHVLARPGTCLVANLRLGCGQPMMTEITMPPGRRRTDDTVEALPQSSRTSRRRDRTLRVTGQCGFDVITKPNVGRPRPE